MRWIVLLVLSCTFAAVAMGQETRPADARPAVAGTIVEVVCYEGSALVTRQVPVAGDGAGLTEIVVGPLPPSLQPGSLYAESPGEGVRVLTTRYRQRAERTAPDEKVRELNEQFAELSAEIEEMQARQQSIEQDLTFMQQLQAFTQSNVRAAPEQAGMKATDFIELATFIQSSREALLLEQVDIRQRLEELAEQQQFVQKELADAKAGGNSRVIREAVVVVDRGEGAAAGSMVQLSYLVGTAGWSPQYRLRADAEATSATLEYLAAVRQNSGEDWTSVQLTLSTAAPNLNASPPELDPVSIALVPQDADATQTAVNRRRSNLKAAREELQQAQSSYGKQAGGFGGGGGQGGGGGYPGDFRSDAKGDYAQKANTEVLNRAAARVMEAEVLGEADFADEAAAGPGRLTEGQSVTFKLPGAVTVPWRDEEQLLEIGRQTLEPTLVHQAVPVLTPNVYRVAELENTGESARVILPGPCGVYLGGDFVGRTSLPLVAVGRPFTVGLGIDPQLSVSRQLVSRDSELRGGNQVRRVEYLLRVENFKGEPVPVRLLDRLPTAPRGDESALGVELVSNSTELSDDPEYLRDERPEGILRWDLTVGPDEPVEVRFAYTLAFDRALEIGGFETR